MPPNDEAQKRAARADAGAELGKTLAAARAARGLTIEEIATELRVEPRLLHALEQCRFEELGPPVFAKGYLKQYGNRLGLKYGDLLAEYYRLVEPAEVALAPSRTIKLRDERQITVWIIAALALALLVVFLMVWLLDEPPAARAPAPAPAQNVEPAAADATARAESDTATESQVGADGGAAGADATALPEPNDGPAAAAGDASGSPATPDEAAVLRAATEAAPAVVAATESDVPAGAMLTIEFAFLEDCWLEATDARGARLFYGLGQAGARRRVTGEPPIDVFLGNANGVALTVDGEPYLVPARDRDGNLARFLVDAPAD
jgi:cytoskeleton protein RodZ